MQTGMGQVLEGASRGLSTASMPVVRTQITQGVGKVLKLILASLWDASVRKLGKALSRMANRQNRDQASHSGKQQTARPHSVFWWLSHQRPVWVELHCQAVCGYQPWKQCSLFSLNLQLDSGDRSSCPCPLLDCLKRWQLDHICHYSHSFSELAKKKVKSGMEAQTGMCQWSTATFKNSCGGIALDMLEWRENDQADRLAGKATLTSGLLLRRSEVLRSLRVQNQGHHTIDHQEERHGKKKC